MSIYDMLLSNAMGEGGGGGGSSDFVSVTFVADNSMLTIYVFSDVSWEANPAEIHMQHITDTSTTIGLSTAFNGFYAIEQEESMGIEGTYSNIEVDGVALWKIDGDCTITYVGGGED